MNAERVKSIVQEARDEMSNESEREIRYRVQAALRKREQIARRVKSIESDLLSAQGEASALDAAIAKAEAGDASELPQVNQDTAAGNTRECPPPNFKLGAVPPGIARDFFRQLVGA